MLNDILKMFRLVVRLLNKLISPILRSIKKAAYDSPKEVKGLSYVIFLYLFIVATAVFITLLYLYTDLVLLLAGPWLFVYLSFLLYKKKPSNKPRQIPGRKK